MVSGKTTAAENPSLFFYTNHSSNKNSIFAAPIIFKIMNQKETLRFYGAFEEHLSAYLQTHDFSKIFILADSCILDLFYERIICRCEVLSHAEILETDCGETAKDLEIAAGVWSTLMQLQADRNSLLIGLGGGSITDLCGFLATTYMRGMPFVLIPTTLLAQTDAAIGGKNGINFEGGKNIIGTFNMPNAIFLDHTFLSTLDHRQLLSGFAEMLKYGLALNKNYWNKLLQIELPNISQEWIEEAVNLKVQLIEKDFNDYGERRKLNFGHTFGHALESWSQQTKRPYFHGEAVAVGLVFEAFLSLSYAALSKPEFDSIYQFISKHYAMPHLTESDLYDLIQRMKIDKKNSRQNFNFTLLNAIGSSKTNTFIPEENLTTCLKTFFQIL